MHRFSPGLSRFWAFYFTWRIFRGPGSTNTSPLPLWLHHHSCTQWPLRTSARGFPPCHTRASPALSLSVAPSMPSEPAHGWHCRFCCQLKMYSAVSDDSCASFCALAMMEHLFIVPSKNTRFKTTQSLSLPRSYSCFVVWAVFGKSLSLPTYFSNKLIHSLSLHSAHSGSQDAGKMKPDSDQTITDSPDTASDHIPAFLSHLMSYVSTACVFLCIILF